MELHEENKLMREALDQIASPNVHSAMTLRYMAMTTLAIVSQAQANLQNAYPRILEGQALQQIPLPEEFLPVVPKQQK